MSYFDDDGVIGCLWAIAGALIMFVLIIYGCR